MNKARDSMINISCAANETMQRLCILIGDGYAAQCGRVLAPRSGDCMARYRIGRKTFFV